MTGAGWETIRLATFAVSIAEPPPTDTKPSTSASRAKSAAAWKRLERRLDPRAVVDHDGDPLGLDRRAHALGDAERRHAGIGHEQGAGDAEALELPAGVGHRAGAELDRRRLEREDRLAVGHPSSSHGSPLRSPRTTVRDALDSAVIALDRRGLRHAAARRRGAARARAGRRTARRSSPTRARARAATRRARSWTPRGGAARASRSPTSSAARASATLELAVDPRVLIPRPETEHVVEAALALPEGARVVDVGTGSGAIALALKDERPDLEVVGTDVSAGRARRRARQRGAARARRRASSRATCWPASRALDAVVSNPPYVARRRPAAARGRPLRAGASRCFARRRRARRHPPARARGGAGAPFVALEVGAGQADGGRGAAARGGLRRIERVARPRRHRARGGRPAMTRAEASRRCIAARRRRGVPRRHGLRARLRPRDADGGRRGCTRSRAARRTSRAAVMFFDAGLALAALPELGARTRALLGAAAARRRDAAAAQPARPLPLACGPDPETLGLRVPDLPALAGVARPCCRPREPRRRRPTRAGSTTSPSRSATGADLVLDGGELPGHAVDRDRPARATRPPASGRRARGRRARGRSRARSLASDECSAAPLAALVPWRP